VQVNGEVFENSPRAEGSDSGSMPFYQTLVERSTRLWSTFDQTLVESLVNYRAVSGLQCR
jgi:hypothetical protein